MIGSQLDSSLKFLLAAEKRFNWFMSILRFPEGGPLGRVVDSIIKKEY